MLMPHRSYASTANYRFGFNGKENDNEPKGLGNQQDYGMRFYDTRLAKFLSVDPLSIEYPWNSTYAYAENDPISNIDLDGLEKVKSTSFGSLLGQGMKKGIDEFTGGIKSTSKAVFNTNTYRNAWKSVKSFGNQAMRDPNSAVKSFNKGMLGFSMGISNTIQQYTSKPLLWALNSPNRSREENIVGLGYGLWKATELVIFVKVPELLESSEGEAIIAQMQKSEFRAFEGNQIIRQAIKDEVKFVIAQTDELAYLKARNAKAAYIGGEGKDGTILITSSATRSHILEEAIHHEQRLLYGDDYFYSNRNLLEIQAQDKLLEIGQREGWSKSEIEEIQNARKTYVQALKNEKKK